MQNQDKDGSLFLDSVSGDPSIDESRLRGRFVEPEQRYQGMLRQISDQSSSQPVNRSIEERSVRVASKRGAGRPSSIEETDLETSSSSVDESSWTEYIYDDGQFLARRAVSSKDKNDLESAGSKTTFVQSTPCMMRLESISSLD